MKLSGAIVIRCVTTRRAATRRAATRRAYLRASLLFLSAVCSAGCGGVDVDYVLVFPSTETFLVAANVRVEVYPADENPDQACRELSIGLPLTREPAGNTGQRDACEFWGEDGGVTMENIPVGRSIFFAQAADRNGTAILRGCHVADVYHDNLEPLRITLATLPTYPDNPTLTCSTPDQKCAERVNCFGEL